jgi:choline dehydrogenase
MQLGRKYRYPRGNGLGGSTNHHALVDGRGSAQIYDQIAKLVGDKRWSYQNVLPYYKKMESYNISPTDLRYHGTDGWLQITRGSSKSPFHKDLIKAAHQTTGAPIRQDASGNPKNADGISVANIHVTPDGKRSSAFKNLLVPQIARNNNIIVLFNTLITKVLIESEDGILRAIGVEGIHKPHAYQVDNSLIDPKADPNQKALKVRFNAKAEIILSGGAINTPQLLLLSGIGPAKHLNEMNIPAVLDRPGVGSDLMDHHEVAITYEINPDKMVWPSQAVSIIKGIDSYLEKSRDNENKKNKLQKLKTHLARFADGIDQKIGEGDIILDWYSGMPSTIGHDLHIAAGEGFFFDFDFTSREPLPDGTLRSDYFNSQFTVTHPHFPRVFQFFLLEALKLGKADGSIRLASSDPTVQPILDLALYKDEEAIERMARGILMIRKIVRHPLLKHYYKTDNDGNPIEIFPGPKVKTIDQLKEYLKRWSSFGHHISGTAKMGRLNNPSAVVDTQLRVQGIPNLRVIDTSIYPFPYMHGYNTARGAYLIGEMGADFIKADAQKKKLSPKDKKLQCRPHIINKQTTTIPIEHVVVTSNRSFEQVKESLEKKMNVVGDIDELITQLKTANVSWEQSKQAIEKRFGKSDFGIFSKIKHGLLLSLAGKPRKAIQYTIGNPLLAVQMTKHVWEAALYAPFKLLIYEDDTGRTIITYDRFSSLLSPFHNEEVNRIAQVVDKKLEDLVTTVT